MFFVWRSTKQQTVVAAAAAAANITISGIMAAVLVQTAASVARRAFGRGTLSMLHDASGVELAITNRGFPIIPAT